MKRKKNVHGRKSLLLKVYLFYQNLIQNYGLYSLILFNLERKTIYWGYMSYLTRQFQEIAFVQT